MDVERFSGACYKADNWILAGLTTGRGKNNKTRAQLPSKKAVFVRALRKISERDCAMSPEEALKIFLEGPQAVVDRICELDETVRRQANKIEALENKIARLSKNSSNSGKRPSSDDIVKPKPSGKKNGDKKRKIGGIGSGIQEIVHPFDGGHLAGHGQSPYKFDIRASTLEPKVDLPPQGFFDQNPVRKFEPIGSTGRFRGLHRPMRVHEFERFLGDVHLGPPRIFPATISPKDEMLSMGK